jgi:hypothetical protein
MATKLWHVPLRVATGTVLVLDAVFGPRRTPRRRKKRS